MAKLWSDVAASSAFQALNTDEQEEARQQYFDEVVAPQVPEEDLGLVRGQFDEDTIHRAAPSSAPMTRGGHRGPMVTQLDDGEEQQYRQWMQSIGHTKQAGFNVDDNLTGKDYDYRGFYKKYGAADVQSGQHLTDEFKLPNHETFSDESRYAVGANRARAGRWRGDKFIPPGQADAIPIPEDPRIAGALQPDDPSLERALQRLPGNMVRSAGAQLKETFAGTRRLFADLQTGMDVAKAKAYRHYPTDDPRVKARQESAAQEAEARAGAAELDQGRAARDTRRAQAEEQAAIPADAGPIERSVQSGLSSALITVPIVTLGAAVPGGQAPALAALGGMTGASRYGELRAAGLDEGSAAVSGAALGGLEALTEAIPLGTLAKKSPFMHKAMEFLVQDVLGENVSSLAQLADDYRLQLRDDVTIGDIQRSIADTTTSTIAGVGAQMSVSGLMDAVIAHANERAQSRAPQIQIPTDEQIQAGVAAPADATNHTPPESLSAQMGLTPIVVPNVSPAKRAEVAQEFGFDQLQESPNVSPMDAAAAVPAAGGPGASADLSGGLAGTGSAPAVGGQHAAAGSPVGDRKQVGAVPTQGGEQAAPVKQWFGRAGDGYKTEGDARQALPGRQRMHPELSWAIDQMPNGKYRLAGYAAQTQAPAAEQPAASAADGDYIAFPPASGTRGVPRADMPQVKAEHRGALVNFLNARGVEHEQQEVPSSELKATQAEYSPAKVDKAKTFTGGDRSILVSSDSHIVDGHHQWIAKLDEGAPVKVIRLNAPIEKLLPLVKEFPSSTSAGESSVTEAAQTVETETQGSQASADAGSVGTVAKTTAPAAKTELPSARVEGLKIAPPAPVRDIAEMNEKLRARSGVEIEQVAQKDISEGHRVASAVARVFGKTLTVVRQKAGDPRQFPNGFVKGYAGKHVFIADNTEDAPLAVAMHEIYHTLPHEQRVALNSALLALTHRHDEFSHQYKADADNIEEELPAFIAQALSKRGEFWNELREKMGNKEFAKVARVIIDKLSELLTGFSKDYGDEFLKKYVTDIARARNLLTDAYAAAQRGDVAKAETREAEPVMSRRAAYGDFQASVEKDGSVTVHGNAEDIRALLPEDVVGRSTKDGMKFMTSDASRVRASLEGRKVAYGRGGGVTERLPVRDGVYVGAPEKFNTPAKIPSLRKWLKQLALEGEPGRMWYENSSAEVLRMVGGSVQEARKFAALLAIYSPQAKVDTNATFALRAWAQHKAGQQISVKTRVMDQKATEALNDVDAFWSGEKTGNFVTNLLRKIDPSLEQGATIDMWMMRAAQYGTDAPGATQYSFMENEVNRLAKELGWEPQQVQAAIWVAMKARMESKSVKQRTEAKSEKKGWIKFETNDGKKVRKILNKEAHRDNWLATAFAHTPTEKDTSAAKFDFGDGLRRHIGQVSFEARPGRSTGVLPGSHDAAYALQVQFQQDVQKALYDKDGVDLLAQKLGLLVDSDIVAPGVWNGEISPSSQKSVAMAPGKGDENKGVDPAQRKALDTYAAVLGLLARQEGVGWHRPFYIPNVTEHNGLDIDIGRPVNPREAADLEKAVGKWMTDNGKGANWSSSLAFISSPKGIRIVNFGVVTNAELRKQLFAVAETVLPDFEARSFKSDGGMPINDWKESPDGQGYVQGIRAAGRSDVLDWARDVLAPRVQAVFERYSEEHNWGDPGELHFSNRAAAIAGEESDAIDRRRILTQRTLRSYRERNGASSRAYTRRSREDGAGTRVLVVSAIAEFGPTVRFKNALADIGAASPSFYELGADGAAIFRDAIGASKKDNKFGAAVYVYPKEEYRNMRLFLAKDGRAGFALKGDDIVSVFALEPHKGAAAGIIELAIQEGGRRLDAFDTVLPDLYAGNSFKIVARIPWNEEYKPDDWNKSAFSKYHNGEPDVVFMVHDPEYFGKPSNADGAMVKSYDDGVAEQRKALRAGSDEPVFSNRAEKQPTFYSSLTRAAENASTAKASAPQWLATLKNTQGVKEEELQWVGLGDWLVALGHPATKQEVVDYLRANEIQVKEVVKEARATTDSEYTTMAHRADDLGVHLTMQGFTPEFDESGLKYIVDRYGQKFEWMPREAARQVGQTQQLNDRWLGEELGDDGELVRAPDDVAKLANELDILQRQMRDSNEEANNNVTKYSKYTTPGGTNYREMLLTLPVAPKKFEVFNYKSGERVAGFDTIAEARADAERRGEPFDYNHRDTDNPDQYHSSHWDEPNILSHVRFDERTDAEGKRVLYIEEIQSDWHQQGRKRGYKGDRNPIDTTGWTAKEESGDPASGPIWAVRDANDIWIIGAPRTTYPTQDAAIARAAEIRLDRSRGARVPDAPFKTTWPELAFKRMLRWAAENNFDRIAWTTGEMQADRYDLSKQISMVQLHESAGGTRNLRAYDLDHGLVINENVKSDDDIADYIGKDVAEKLLASEPLPGSVDKRGNSSGGRSRQLMGLDLKVGGEGMIGFYDQILPKTVGKLVKKFGARVTDTKINRASSSQLMDEADVPESERDAYWSGLTESQRQRLFEKYRIDPIQVHSVDVTPALRDAALAGQPIFSNRVRREEKQTDTAAFKRWFGDSKVVDEKGEPLVVYHGSGRGNISKFKPKVDRFGEQDLGVHFGDAAAANRRLEDLDKQGSVYPVYLSISNPIQLEDRGTWGAFTVARQIEQKYPKEFAGLERDIDRFDNADERKDAMPYLRSKLQSAGYDGAAYDNKYEGGRSFIAFEPQQIKSAIGNDGNFDPQSPSIVASNRARRPWVFERDKIGNFRFAAGARAYRIVADVANAVLDKVKLKPISSDLGRAMRRMQADIAKAKEKAAGVAGKLGTLSPEEREMISDVIEGELRAGVTPPEKILAIAANMQHIMSEQTTQLVDLGMISDESARRWEGKYLPRFYQKQFKDELKAWARAARQLFGKKGAMQGISGNSLKARGLFKDVKVEELPVYEENGWEVRDPGFDPHDSDQVTIWRDFTKEERASMNEIRDSMFRFVMGYMRAQKDIALGRLYQHIANTMSSRGPKDGFVQVPDTSIEGTTAKRYGKLAGKWVPQEVMDHLSAADSSEMNELFKLYLKGVSAWKEGRTVLNPVSHVNNVVSNVTMAHMAGVSYWDAHKYVGAVRDLVKKAAMVTEAKEHGLFGGTFNQTDLLNNMPEQLKVMAGMSESAVTKVAGHVWNAMSFWMRKPLANAYQGEDEFFRYLIYRDARQRGLDPDSSVEYAQEYIFTYDDLPKGARAIRDTVVPFFSWTYKAIPALARTAFEYPWRFAAPAAVLWGANTAMYAIAGGEGDDEPWWANLVRYVRDPEYRAAVHDMEEGERKDLPPWNRGNTAIGTPKVIRMGQDDVTNLPMFLDVSRLMPGGDMFDTENNAGGIPWFAPLDPGGPAVNVLFGMFGNLDYFTGKNITSEADTDMEAAEKRAAWLYQSMAPAIAPFGYHFNRAMNALAYATDTTIDLGVVEYTGFGKDGLPVQPSLAALQTFGIKLRDVDLQQSKSIQNSQRARLIRDISSQVSSLKRLRAAGAISDEAFEDQMEKAREKKARLRQGLTVEGDEAE